MPLQLDRSLSGKLPDALTKDVSPSVGGVLYPGSGYGSDPHSMFPRTDPVLVYLAQGNEQEYERMMRTSWPIRSAIEQRTTGLMAHGDQIIQGRSKSKASAMLADFLREFIDSIGGEGNRGGSAVPRARFTQLRRQVLKALYYGWMPVEFQWSNEDFRFQGRPRSGIVDAKARKPWYYHFTNSGHLALSSGAGNTSQVYDQPDDEGRFMVARAFDTESWYGESFLRGFWMLYFTAQQFQKMSAEGMQRALGLIKATRKQGASAALGTGAGAQSRAEAELLAVLRKLRSNNLLMESQNYSLEVVENSIGVNIMKVMDYFATEQRMAIVGQNLTSKVDGGSYAAAQQHGDILDNYLMADAREELAWWNDGLFRQAIEINFGQVDSDDMPRWQSRIVDRPNMEATKALFDMGAGIDARRLAVGTNAALWEGEEGSDDIVLRKPEGAPALGSGLWDPSAPAQPLGSNKTKARALPPQAAEIEAEAADRAQEAALARAIRTAGPEMEEYYSGLMAKYLRANEDPKG